MATVMLCNRVSAKGKRHKVDGINLKDKVAALRKTAASALMLQIEEIELIYCGQCLVDGQNLESYGIKPGVTVHVLRRKDRSTTSDVNIEPMDKESVKQVVTALQTALINPAFRSTMEKMITNPETMENIMVATPSLSQDPVAVAMLQDPEMLAILADPNHVNKVIEAHPALAHAAMMVAAAVNEEGSQAGGGGSAATNVPRTARGAYSLDQMSDDEEDMDAPPGGQGQAITASQLAAALMAAGAQQPSTSGGSSQSSGGDGGGGGSGGGGISADFFQQAIAQATGAQSSEQQLQMQLTQLRDMGITDELVARQALQATGGDLQAALEILFGDSMQ